jgi:parvulin-like peptidyl-prolyl isomerase
MRHMKQWFGAGLLSLAGMGCVAADFPGQPTAGELVRDLTPVEFARSEAPRLARMQRGDEAPIVLAQAKSYDIAPPPGAPSSPPVKTAPPGIISAPPLSNVAIPPPPGSESSGAQLASLRSNRATHAAVRAWVNGRPIFDDEVLLQLEMTNPDAPRGVSGEKITQAYNKTLTSIIELEIAYQDAVKKLEKGNPKALEKLKEMVHQEYEKQSRGIRKAVSDDKFQEIAPTFRRQLERQFIGMEYIRSRIYGQVNSIGYLEVKDYYDAHLNEFQKIESVKWQHAFIAVNAQRPTLADARRFGESLLDQVRRGADFETIAKFDDGDSKTRNSVGFGSRKGEIQPAELEMYLFEMKDGQIGPIVEISTGVHLFRLVQRDPGGQIPLNDPVQAQIKNKIRNQIFEREFKRFVQDLKSRAVVEIERGQ